MNEHADDVDAAAVRAGVAMVDGVAPVVLAEAAAIERARTLTPPVVDALWDSGLMTFMNPCEAGGREPCFEAVIETWTAMAALDGSFGWTGLANLSSTAAAASYLPATGFEEVFAAGQVTIGGQYAPKGQGEAIDGGVRLTGSYNFGSGTGHAAYIAAGFVHVRDGEPVLDDDGRPDLRVAIVPRDEVRFTDGWFVQGLRGTGSYDYEVDGVFVPEHRTYPLFTREPRRGRAPRFRMGLMAITAAGHAGWALGVARSMLDDVEALAMSKIRMGDAATLAHRPGFQRQLAHHRSLWQSAHLLVLHAFETAEHAVGRGEPLTPRLRAELRAAAVFATDAGRDIAQWAHLAAGTSAIRDGSRLERAFRDLYTGTQHVFINEKVAIEAAQVHLGIVDDHIHL